MIHTAFFGVFKLNVKNTLNLKEGFQFVKFLLCCSPTGDESADGVVMVRLAEMGELYFLTQTVYQSIVHNDKLLIGGRFDEELESLALENILHPHSHLDGMFGELEI